MILPVAQILNLGYQKLEDVRFGGLHPQQPAKFSA
jgi:hypothetical protein